ncbi:MAG: hypothetical protein PVF17_06710, partial [Ignavibacteria bacterium]
MKTKMSFPRKPACRIGRWEFLILFFYILILSSIGEYTFAQMASPSPVEEGSLTIKITGFESNKGECWFGLDNSEEVFESEDTVFIGKILPIV